MVSSQTYYWVGNGGNWNDAANWSTSSGGAGGAGIPTAAIDVIMDNNSGNVVVNAPAQCASLFFNVNSTLTINQPLTVTGTLSHQQGNLILNARLTAGSYISEGNAPRSLMGSSQTFYISGDPGSFLIEPTNYPAPMIDTLIFTGNQGILQSGGQATIDYLEFTANGEVYGDNKMTRWVFANGYSVFIENGSVQTIFDEIVTGPFCDGLAIVSAFLSEPQTATIRWESSRIPFPRGFYFRRIRGEDIVNGLVNDVRYSDGVDGGDNSNISINTGNEVPQRTLFWVGGSGEWRDKSHWSLSSGGPGGECIPTAKDIVNFDNSSFNSPGDIVQNNAEVYISEFNYTASNFPGDFRLNALNVRRSINLTQPLIWGTPTINLVGVDNTVDLTIQTSNNLLNDINVISLRNVTLKDNLNLSGTLNFENFPTNARFRASGFNITADRFIADGSQMELDLSNSYIKVNGILDVGTLEMPLTLRNSVITSTSNTRWELTGPVTGYEVTKLNLGSVWFSAPDGEAYAFGSDDVTLRSLRFEGNGRIYQRSYIVDSLIFTTGHNYTLEQGQQFNVNRYFESEGTLCQPINIGSNLNNSQATFNLPTTATLKMSYTNIKDSRAVGGNAFDAGNGSINLGGNSGWSFRDPNAVERDQFLGPDTMICRIDGFRILPTFSIEEVDSVQWDNGPTEVYKLTSGYVRSGVREQPAQEFDIVARLVYKNGCNAFDTLHVTVDEEFEINLGNDETRCNENDILLTNLNIESDVSYTWSTGSTEDSITASSTGLYSVVGQRGGCRAEDDFFFTKIDLRNLAIGNDTTLCEVDDFIISAPTSFTGDVVWSDGSTGSTININQSGTYWAQFSEDICSYTDTIDVRFETAFSVNLGNDTTICNGAPLVLNTGFDAGTFTWSTGETAPLITIDDRGTYSVSVQVGSCQASDTIVVDRRDIKGFSLGEDQSLCDGTLLELTIPEGYDGDFAWSTEVHIP